MSKVPQKFNPALSKFEPDLPKTDAKYMDKSKGDPNKVVIIAGLLLIAIILLLVVTSIVR